MGAAWEDAKEGGGRAVHHNEFLFCVNTDGAFVWGGEVGVVGANGAEARGSSCGVPKTVDKVKGKKAEGWFVAEGGGEQHTSGSGEKTGPDLLGPEIGNSSGIGVPTYHILNVCTRETGYKGGGKL